MTTQSHHFCIRHVAFLAAMLCCNCALGQQSGEPLLPQSDKDPEAEYTIELRCLTVPIVGGKNGDGESFQRLLADVDPRNIEIQGHGDSLESPFSIVLVDSLDPAFPVTEARTNQPRQLALMTGTSAIVAKITEGQCTQIINSIESDENSSIGQAPTSTVAANEPVTIADGSHRPFTTSVKPLTDEKGHIVAYQPQSQSVFEGSMTQMKVASAGGKIRLELRSDFTNVDRISSVEVNASETPSGTTKIKLQIPHVSSKQIRVISELEPGESLFIIPAWNQVYIRPQHAKVKDRFGVTYVANLFGTPKPRQTDARIAFLVKVVRWEK